ncbi:type VII secretion-associated protein [Rhodococcus sp. ACT016]|uniref:type VII secretion-associated protein n=1 Tax=Rhodococcus sp. ACT016 TaxID=3134808 RepID=UPI003D2D81D9
MTEASVALHLADCAVWVASSSGVVRVRDDAIQHCLECIDDERVLVGAQPVATVDALATALHRVIGTGTQGTGFVPSVTVTHPSHWGSARRGVLESAARRSAHEVALLPIALAVSAPPDWARWVVLECAPLATTASLVERTGRGEPTVRACELASDTGSLDLREHPDRVAVLDRLVCAVADGRPVEHVLVTGAADPDVVEILTAGIGSSVVVVPDADLARVAPAGEAELSDGDSIPAAWLDHRPAPPPQRGPGRAAVVVAAAVLVVAAAAGSVVGFWRPWERANASDTAEPLQRFEIGSVSVQLPGGWNAQPAKPGRLDLTPQGVGGRRIVVIPTDIAEGSDRADVARALERRIVDRGPDGPFSEFDPDSAFAGRQAISYVESPDGRSRVRWHVLVERGVQVSIGCQFRDGEWDALAADCEQAVRSVEVGAA